MKIKFFSSSAKFHEWLDKNHDQRPELWLGFHKKSSGKKGITYSEALDEALCFGWIDGLRKGIDESSYTIRFTPRKQKSIWSLVNTKRVSELSKLGRMKAAGLKAFELRDPKKTGIYSFENAQPELDAAYRREFRSDKKAWEFFSKQPPGYKRIAIYWVMSARQEGTRQRRLDKLKQDSAKGVRLGMITGKKS